MIHTLAEASGFWAIGAAVTAGTFLIAVNSAVQYWQRQSQHLKELRDAYNTWLAETLTDGVRLDKLAASESWHAQLDEMHGEQKSVPEYVLEDLRRYEENIEQGRLRTLRYNAVYMLEHDETRLNRLTEVHNQINDLVNTTTSTDEMLVASIDIIELVNSFKAEVRSSLQREQRAIGSFFEYVISSSKHKLNDCD